MRKILDAEDYARGNPLRTRLMKARLGNDAGLIGAAMLLLVMPFGGIEQAAAAPLKVWLSTAYLGFIGSAVSYLCWGKALALTDKTAKVSNLQFVQPALAMLWGFLIVMEVPTLDMYVGMIIIIFGLVVFSKFK